MHIRTFASILNRAYPAGAPENDDGGSLTEPVTNETTEPDHEPDTQTNPEPEDPAEAEGEEHEGGDDPEGDLTEADAADDADEEEPAPKRRDWRDRRFEKEFAKRKDAEAKADAAAKEAQALRELYSKPEDERSDGERAQTREQIRREVEQQVRQEEWAKRLNSNLDTMFDEGAKDFPKSWSGRVQEAADVFAEEMKANPGFLEALSDLPNRAAVYHELTGDFDKMEAVLKMPPHKMGMELARLSDKLATPKPTRISRTPAPIKPLESTAAKDVDLENMPMEEFAKLRERQMEERYKAKRH